MTTGNPEVLPSPRGLVTVRSTTGFIPRGALPGTSAVALALGAGRWGAYLGLPGHHLYLTDLLVLGACVRAWKQMAHGGKGGSTAVQASLGLLFAYCLLRFVIAGGGPSFNAVRDFAPYAYSLLGILLLGASRRALTEQRETSMRWIRRALGFHLVWVTVDLLLPNLSAQLPTLNTNPTVHVLDLRSDFDGMVVALLAILALQRALFGPRLTRGRYYTLAAISIGVTLELHSRASLISLFVGLLYFLVSGWRASNRTRKFILGVLPFVALMAVVVIPQTTAGQRLLLENPSSLNAQSGAEASGTTTARLNAWTQVIHYTDSRPTRQLIGVGFGPDFMKDSGALYLLVGIDPQDDVRSPHNYLVGSYARLGVVGLGILLSMIVVALLRCRRALARDDDLQILAALLIVMLLTVSLMGVILESPFGAVPFFWAIGVVSMPVCSVSSDRSQRP